MSLKDEGWLECFLRALSLLFLKERVKLPDVSDLDPAGVLDVSYLSFVGVVCRSMVIAASELEDITYLLQTKAYPESLQNIKVGGGEIIST